MAVSRVDRLRLLMGDIKFADESRKGTIIKAESEEKRIKDAVDEAARVEVERLKAEETQKAAIQGPMASYEGPTITVEYADMDEIMKKIRPQRAKKHAIGELAKPGMDFCPIVAVSKFPYKYMDPQSQISDKVSKGYFANEKFWNREWTLYYIHPPVSVSTTPLVLVPAREVNDFLAWINKRLDLNLRLEGSGRQRGLLIDFPDDGTPRPRYLGTSDSKRMYTAYEHSIPKAFDEMPSTDRSFEAFKRKIEAGIEATKNRKKRSKQKRQQEKALTKSDWSRQLRRAQRYLGLRAQEQEAVSLGRALALDEPVPELAYDVAPRHPFDSDVIFISVDVESYERSHNQITEIGIATLDSRALTGIASGQLARNWQDKVKARHFIIDENAHLVNSKYVDGCPSSFEKQFGISERISIKDAKSHITSCFQISNDEGKHRTIILVGHDIQSDVNFLRALELDIANLPSVLEVMDTANLYSSLKQLDQSTSLANVLCNLGIIGWNLHNAGNDAGYTLQALLAIVVDSLRPESPNTTLEDRIELAKKEAEQQVRDNAEEWAYASLHENDDEGVPLRKSRSSSADGKATTP